MTRRDISARVAKITAENRQGTGAFIGANTLLTCAHVVGRRGTSCRVHFKENVVDGVVRERLMFESELQSEPRYPDLAIVELNVAMAHGVIALAPSDREAIKPCVYGFPIDRDGITELQTPIIIGGPAYTGVSGAAQLLNISDGILRPGMSGAPLLDVDGEVVGIASYARDYSEPLGGYAIPASTIRTFLVRFFDQPTDREIPRTRIIGLDMLEMLKWLGYATQDGDGYFQPSYLNRVLERLVRRLLDDDAAATHFTEVETFDRCVSAVQSLQQAFENVGAHDYDKQKTGRLRPEAARGIFGDAIRALQWTSDALLKGGGTKPFARPVPSPQTS